MINYSISLRANPSDQDAPKKAYANAQYSDCLLYTSDAADEL